MASDTKHTPGPWRVGYLTGSIVCENAKIGGEAKLFDVRGWGYLTGLGHGALGLSVDEAKAIQDANAALCAAAPDMLAALKAQEEADEALEEQLGYDKWQLLEDTAKALRSAAFAKAT